MKKTSYKRKVKGDLLKALYEKRSALNGFRFGSTGSKVRNVKTGSTLRKEIARIMTELNAIK